MYNKLGERAGAQSQENPRDPPPSRFPLFMTEWPFWVQSETMERWAYFPDFFKKKFHEKLKSKMVRWWDLGGGKGEEQGMMDRGVYKLCKWSLKNPA